MIDLAIDSRVFINTPLEEAVQELDLLFNTTNTELIGYPNFGTNFEQFLWNLGDESDRIRDYIYEQLQYSYFLRDFNVDIDVSQMTGQFRNIYRVSITISDNDGNSESREYQLR